MKITLGKNKGLENALKQLNQNQINAVVVGIVTSLRKPFDSSGIEVPGNFKELSLNICNDIITTAQDILINNGKLPKTTFTKKAKKAKKGKEVKKIKKDKKVVTSSQKRRIKIMKKGK